MQEAQQDLASRILVRWVRLGAVAPGGALSGQDRLGGLSEAGPTDVPCPLLSPDDQERAGRFRRPEDRARFVMGRLLLAKILRDHLGHAPAAFPALAYTEHRRPYLTDMPNIVFSISHAEEIVAVALASGCAVGLDVEFMPRQLDLAALAERIFNREDLETFRGLPPGAQNPAFFRAWTGKEAYLKAAGLGLFGGMEIISVPLVEAASPEALNVGVAPIGGLAWRFQCLAMPPDYAGTVVWHAPDKGIDSRELRLEEVEGASLALNLS